MMCTVFLQLQHLIAHSFALYWAITGPDHTRPDHTGPDHTGPDHTGPDHTGLDHSILHPYKLVKMLMVKQFIKTRKPG